MNRSPPTARRPWLDRAERFGRGFENLTIALVLCGLVGLAGVQIVLRNLFSMGLPWSDGLIRLGVLWLAVLGAVVAARDDRHLAIDIVARFAPPTWRRWAGALSSAGTAIVTGLLARYSWRFVQDSRSFGDVLLDHWPAWYFQAILPIGFALISYRYSLRCLQRLLGR